MHLKAIEYGETVTMALPFYESLVNNAAAAIRNFYMHTAQYPKYVILGWHSYAGINAWFAASPTRPCGSIDGAGNWVGIAELFGCTPIVDPDTEWRVTPVGTPMLMLSMREKLVWPTKE